MKPEEKSDVTGRLIGAFKELISEGALAPGGRLPAEREMAGSFGVSRSSLRQALKVLESMGVISQHVGNGTYLNANATAVLTQPMEFLVLLAGIPLTDLMEARLIVEPELAARAAARVTPAGLAELRAIHAAMEAARKEPAKFVKQDLAFHQAIFRFADNQICSLMFSVVHQLLAELMAITSKLVQAEHTLTLHRRVLAAIAKGDPAEARKRMAEHLEDARELLERGAARQVQRKLHRRMAALAPSLSD
jgi:GntR family transcriptional repressor for pyruvate dehydrogenase complex